MKTTLESVKSAYEFQFCYRLIAKNCQNDQLKYKVAISADGHDFTYDQLRKDVLHLVSWLQSKGVTTEATIGIYLDPSYWYVVSMLAIWEVGAHFVSLNTAPEYGLLSVQSILDQVKPQWIISRNNPFLKPQNVLLLSDMPKLFALFKQSDLPEIQPNHLAYIAFTSGSTGVPKGIEIEHTGVYNCMRGYSEILGITAKDQLSWFAQVSFDAHIMEILISLLAGATLHIVPSASKRNADEIVAFYGQHRITTSIFTPSLLSVLNPQLLPDLHTITSTGEKLEPEVRTKWLRSGKIRIYDGYGPAEVTVATSMGFCTEEGNGGCGKPLPGLEILILEKVPKKDGLYRFCDRGEIFIAGVGLARGYYNNPVLTSKLFPIISIEGREAPLRVYKSKDLGLRDEFGNYHIIGRKGRQLKIHSQLYHPAQTETLLMQQQLVPMTRVYVHGVLNQKKYPVITVYCQPNNTVEDTHAVIKMLRTYVMKHLPLHHQPTLWAFVKELPLNQNMKIDANALMRLAVQKQHVANRLRREPVDQIEHKLSEIFHGIVDEQLKLGCEDALIFVATSIQILACVNKINDTFNLKLTLIDFLNAPTIAAVARKIRSCPSALIQLNERFPVQPTTQPVLFLIHAVLGDALQDYCQFAQQWHETMPVVGIQAPGLVDVQAMPCTMNELVDIYCQKIKSHQATGPYFIGGHSAGGIIGHAIAARLAEENVVLFAFDTDIKPFTSRSFAEYLLGLVVNFIDAEFDITVDQVENLANDAQVIRVFSELEQKHSGDVSKSKRILTLRNIILACISYDINQPISNMILYTTGETKRFHLGDSRLGWSAWQPLNTVHYEEQTHQTIVNYKLLQEDVMQQVVQFKAYFADPNQNAKLARLHLGKQATFDNRFPASVIRKLFFYLGGADFVAASQVATSWYRIAREFKLGRYIVPAILFDKKCYSLGHSLGRFLEQLSNKKVLLIYGPSGIGKSRALAYIAEQLQWRGYSVFRRELGDYSIDNIGKSLKQEINQWQADTIGKHRFVILDAEDELGKLSFNHRLPNLYQKMKLANYDNTTLIISCRNEIFNQRYQYDFVPQENFGALVEWQILPLTRMQASLLRVGFKSQPKSFDDFYIRLPAFIRENTLLLIYALQLSTEFSQDSFNVLTFYQLLTAKYVYEWQSSKPGLEPVADNLAEECAQYAEAIALTLIGMQKKQLMFSQEKNGVAALLFSPENLKLMKHIHIEKTDTGYKFSHASFVGFYAATAIAKMFQSRATPAELQVCFATYDLQPVKLVNDSHFVEFWRLLSSDLISARLLECILASRQSPDLAGIAGLAMTLANCNKMRFPVGNLRYVVIKDAVLDYGNYQGVDFFGAKFINVSAIRVYFDQAKLQKVVFDKVKFDHGVEYLSRKYARFQGVSKIVTYSFFHSDRGSVHLQIIDLNVLNCNDISLKFSEGVDLDSSNFGLDIIVCSHLVVSNNGKYVLGLPQDRSQGSYNPVLCFELKSAKLIKKFSILNILPNVYISNTSDEVYYLSLREPKILEVVIQSFLTGEVQRNLMVPDDGSTQFAIDQENILLTFKWVPSDESNNKFDEQRLAAINVYQIGHHLAMVSSIDVNLVCKMVDPRICRFYQKAGLLAIAFSLSDTPEEVMRLNIYDMKAKKLLFFTAIRDFSYDISEGMIVYRNDRGYILAEDLLSKRRLYQQLCHESRVSNFNIVKGGFGIGIVYQSTMDQARNTIKTVFKPIAENNYILGNRLQPDTVQDFLFRANLHFFQDEVDNPLVAYDHDSLNQVDESEASKKFKLLWLWRNKNMHNAHSPVNHEVRSEFNLLMAVSEKKIVGNNNNKNTIVDLGEDVSPATILKEHYHQYFLRMGYLSFLSRSQLIINMKIARHNDGGNSGEMITFSDFDLGLRVHIATDKIFATNRQGKRVWSAEINIVPKRAWLKSGTCIVYSEHAESKAGFSRLGLLCCRYDQSGATLYQLPNNTHSVFPKSCYIGISSGRLGEEVLYIPDRNEIDCYNVALSDNYLVVQNNNILRLYLVQKNFEFAKEIRLGLTGRIHGIFFHHDSARLFVLSGSMLVQMTLTSEKPIAKMIGSLPQEELIQSVHCLDDAIFILSDKANHYVFAQHKTNEYRLSQRSSNLLSCNAVRIDGCQGLSLSNVELLQSKGADGYPQPTVNKLIENQSDVLNLENFSVGNSVFMGLKGYCLSNLSVLRLSKCSLQFHALQDILQAAQGGILKCLRQLLVDNNQIQCGLIELEKIIIPMIEASKIIFCDLSMNYIGDGLLLSDNAVPASAVDDQRCSLLLQNRYGLLHSIGSSTGSLINSNQKISQQTWLVRLAIDEKRCVLSFEGVRPSGQCFLRVHEFQLQAREVMTLRIRELNPAQLSDMANQVTIAEAIITMPNDAIDILLRYFTDEAAAEIANMPQWNADDWQVKLVKWLNQLLSKNAVHLNQLELDKWLVKASQSEKCTIC